MRYHPIAIAFVAAMLGAAAVGVRPGANWDDFAPLLVGAALAAATTGIVASFMQFLPDRLFGPLSLPAGALVSLAVMVLLRAAEYMGLAPAPLATALVWATAAVVALLTARASGVGLPWLRRVSRTR
jgi:hypothetical protein